MVGRGITANAKVKRSVMDMLLLHGLILAVEVRQQYPIFAVIYQLIVALQQNMYALHKVYNLVDDPLVKILFRKLWVNDRM